MTDEKSGQCLADLVPQEFRSQVDAMTYEQLLYGWRHRSLSDVSLQGSCGRYWACRMIELRTGIEGERLHADASRSVGWGRYAARR